MARAPKTGTSSATKPRVIRSVWERSFSLSPAPCASARAG